MSFRRISVVLSEPVLTSDFHVSEMVHCPEHAFSVAPDLGEQLPGRPLQRTQCAWGDRALDLPVQIGRQWAVPGLAHCARRQVTQLLGAQPSSRGRPKPPTTAGRSNYTQPLVY